VQLQRPWFLGNRLNVVGVCNGLSMSEVMRRYLRIAVRVAIHFRLSLRGDLRNTLSMSGRLL